jgi:hypothetical protein
MSKEKQIEYERNEMAEIIAQNFRLNEERYNASEFEWSAHCLQMAGYRKQEWISVEERLPTCRELVLVSSMDLSTKKHGWFYLARYTNLQNDGVRFDDKRWLTEDGGIFGRVTHWMPLPEVPKMKGGAE